MHERELSWQVTQMLLDRTYPPPPLSTPSILTHGLYSFDTWGWGNGGGGGDRSYPQTGRAVTCGYWYCTVYNVTEKCSEHKNFKAWYFSTLNIVKSLSLFRFEADVL